MRTSVLLMPSSIKPHGCNIAGHLKENKSPRRKSLINIESRNSIKHEITLAACIVLVDPKDWPAFAFFNHVEGRKEAIKGTEPFKHFSFSLYSYYLFLIKI